MYTTAFPCPHLRRDVIKHLQAPLVGELGHAQVEARIIHQNHRIRLIVNHIFLGLGDVTQHLAQVDRHLHEAHIGHQAVMLHQLDALGLHHVAAKAPKLGFLVLLLDLGHEVGGVHVARSLACYDIVFHGFTVDLTRKKTSSIPTTVTTSTPLPIFSRFHFTSIILNKTTPGMKANRNGALSAKIERSRSHQQAKPKVILDFHDLCLFVQILSSVRCNGVPSSRSRWAPQRRSCFARPRGRCRA